MKIKPIRFVRPIDQIDTPYYNLGDLITFLTANGIIRNGQIKPQKGKKWLKLIEGEEYFHWAAMDFLVKQFRPLLINPFDWQNTQSLFRKIYFEIDDPNKSFSGFGREEVTKFFQQISNQ